MKRMLAMILAIVLSLGSFAAAEALTGADHDTLVVATMNTMSGNFMDEIFGNNTSDADVRTLVHGYQLVRWFNETGNFGIDPSVVSGITGNQNQDGSITYHVNLYSDLLYSDGTLITAYDYAFAILLRASPELAELGASTSATDYIAGVQEYRNREAETISGVRVVSETQINITIDSKYIPFFYELGALSICPYPIQEIAPACRVIDSEDGIRLENREAFTVDRLRKTLMDGATGYISHPGVSSGPYVLTSWNAETGAAEFAINPYYKGDYQGAKPVISRLIYRSVTEDEAVAGLMDGSIGLVTKATLAETITAGLSGVINGNLSSSNYTRTGLSFISFNCEKNTVGEAAVRQALAMCFDRDSFTETMTGNYGIRTDGYYGIGQWMYQLVNGDLSMEDENQQEKLDSLSLDGLTGYQLNTSAAAGLLEANGWKLNAEGIREKDGVALELVLYTAAESGAETALQDCFATHAGEAGVRITVKVIDGTELLEKYYRRSERDNDMFFLGTNFSGVFDPSLNFSPDGDGQATANYTGLKDEQLYQLAMAMHSTKSGDVVAYCTKWVAFQEYFTQVLPMIPLYSNVYFDFYENTLHNYQINANISWAAAINEAYLGDEVETIE